MLLALRSFLGALGGRVWGALGIAAAALGLGLLARKSGKDAARVDQLEDKLGDVQTRRGVEDRIAAGGDAERRRLREKWTKRG
jgi:hypothetical protein